MIVQELLWNILKRYILLNPYWKLFTYIVTMLFMKCMVKYSKRKKLRVSKCFLIIILFFYLVTVYASTVLARNRMLGEADILPFLWSWRQALAGRRSVLYMVVENIIMLMPIGVFLPFIFNNRLTTLQIIVIGFVFSLFIEVSQKILQVGVFEVDDLLNNTLGVALGCAFSNLLKITLRISE